MTTADLYDLMLKVHEEQGRHSERMNDLDTKIGEVYGIASRLDRTLRGSNGDAGLLSRVSMIEGELVDKANAADIATLTARMSERARAEGSRASRFGHRARLVSVILAATITAAGGVAAAAYAHGQVTSAPAAR